MTKRRVEVTAPAVTPGHRIDEVYIAVIDHHDDSVPEVLTLPIRGNRMPLVAIDRKSLEELRRYAQIGADKSGNSVSIICFTNGTLHDTLFPSTTGDKRS